MTNVEIRIAKRVAVYMLDVAEQQVDMHFFQGLGLALAVIFEEITGRSATNAKPREIIEWAKNLPDTAFPHVHG